MEVICKEVRRPFTWFYCPEAEMYIRHNKSGEVNGTITKRNLPDPLSILEHRIRLKKEGRIHKDARVYADPVTIQLWEHSHA